MKTKTINRISAAALAVTLIGGAVPVGFTGISLFDTSVTVNAEEAVVSFSNKTGTLTIKAGEINPNDIKHFAKDKRVKHVVCERGAILPANCNGLFRDYMAEDIDLSKADGSKVKKMNYMFSCCQNLKTLDISSLYGGTDQMEMMFKYCSSLTTIYVSDRWEGVLGTYDVIWNPDWEGVFRGCTSLKGGNGTAYSENGDHYYYAVIDRSDRPGYMTEVKPKVLAKGVKIDQSEATLKAEKMEQTVFTAYITNDDVSVDSIKWSSSDPTIASVDEQGTVTAIQKGKVTITATATNGTADTSDDKAASCTVTVTSDGSVGTARFDESTGILTLGGNVTMEQIQIHRENVNVKQVVADKGTVLPEDCSIMFSRFGATYGEEQDGDWDQEGPFWKGLEYVDLSRADSSKVKYMEAMFAQCYKLKVIDLSGLDTSNVTSMYCMFYDCNPYAILVSDKWDMTKVINKNSDGGMFYGCTDLIGGNGTKYDSDHIDGEYARIDKKGQLGYFIDKAAVKPAKSLKLDKTEIELIIGSKEEEEITVSSSPKDTTSRSVKWTSSDNNIAYYSDRYGKIIAKSEGTAIITVVCDNCTPNPADDVKAECTVTVKMPDTPSASLDRKTGILTLKGNVSKNDLEAYKEIKGIKKIVAEKGAVLPEDCSNLIAGETDIYYNDYWWDLEEIDLSNADSSKVTNMYYMLSACHNVKAIDLSGFDTSNVTNMTGMFSCCESLKDIKLSAFDTSNVTKMSNMFSQCKLLEHIDITSFNTSKVTDMRCMFDECESLKEIDLSGFDTSKVTDIAYMFEKCSSLKTIYVSEKWSTENAEKSGEMFTGCGSLTGGNGTAYTGKHTNKLYARIDTKEKPGYLTLKPTK